MAQVQLTVEAFRQFDHLPVKIRGRLQRIIDRLENWPNVSGAKPLSGHLVGWFRIRTGDYRLRFFVEEWGVVVDKIGHRRDFYED